MQKNDESDFSNDRSTNGSPRSAILRWVPLAAGTTLAIVGMTRRSKSSLALVGAGGALAFFGSRPRNTQQDFIARGSVLLNCSPEEAYGVYRNFEDLPKFMRHLESVTKTGDKQYRWKAIGPLGVPLEWDSEIVDDLPGELISWRSLPGSALNTEGTVSFRPAPRNRGTLLATETRYDHPAGALGRTIAKMLGKDPSFLMQQDLRRFKAFVETGEIPTTEGQSHGPRSGLTSVMRIANPDQPLRRGSRKIEVLNENRRTA